MPIVNVMQEHELKNAYIGIPDPTSIVLDKSSISLTTVGQTEQITATIEPEVSDKTITGSSDDTTVATVSTTGLVTCVTPGTCTITATTVNGLTASCSVGQGWQPGANTLAYYPLKWDAKDYSGNGLNASATSGTITYPNNEYLNISNGYVRFPTCIPSSTRTAPLTLSVWMKGVTGRYDDTTIFSIGMDGGNGGGWMFKLKFESIANSKVQGSFCNTSNQEIKTTGYVIDNTSWNNIILTINPTSSRGININGENKQTTNINATLRSPSNISSIGQTGANYGEWISGDFGEIIIENKVWTEEERTNYFNLVKAKYGL